MKRNQRRQKGFTLIELIVVVTIIGILAAVAVVNVRNAQRKAQEAALRDDLHEMRKAIDDFYADKQRYPTDLSELTPNYMRKIPNDPITKQPDWDNKFKNPFYDEQGPKEEKLNPKMVVRYDFVVEFAWLDEVPTAPNGAGGEPAAKEPNRVAQRS